MPTKLALAAALVVAVAHDLKTQKDAHEAAKLYLKAHQAHKENEAVSAHQIEYLMNMLQKHDVEVTEFDLIALNIHSHE